MWRHWSKNCILSKMYSIAEMSPYETELILISSLPCLYLEHMESKALRFHKQWFALNHHGVYGKCPIKRPGLNQVQSWNKHPVIVKKFLISAYLKLGTNLNKKKRRIFVINLEGRLWFLWNNYLPDIFCCFYFFIFLIRVEIQLSAQSKEAFLFK